MRKFILGVLVAVFGLSLINAQDSNATPPISYGLRAGVNFSDITGKMVESFSGRTSFYFGGVVEIPLCETFSIQPEIIYSSQGSDYDEGEFDVEGTVKVNYLNIPVMAKYYVIPGLSIEAGPQIGFLLSATDEYDDEEDDIKEFLKSTDFGINFGLGYKLNNGLNFSARYNLGLTDNLDTDEFEVEGAEYKNSVIQLGIGYFF